MKHSSIWIILVNYNGAADTVECLSSIRENAPECQVIVVDNGSADGSANSIRIAHPWAEVIETGQNLGFTGGNNIGIRRALDAGAEWIWVLNNDTTVQPGAVAELLGAAESDNSWGILSPQIDYYDSPGEPWFAGARLDLQRSEALHDNAFPSKEAGAIEIPWATGCAMFCRREALEQTGGFDDRFFLTWEDVDLSLRVRAKGWKLGLVPRSRVRHKVSRSRRNGAASSDIYYTTRNRMLVVWLHSTKTRLRSTLRCAMHTLYLMLRYIAKREPRPFTVCCASGLALFDFARGRFGKLGH